MSWYCCLASSSAFTFASRASSTDSTSAGTSGLAIRAWAARWRVASVSGMRASRSSASALPSLVPPSMSRVARAVVGRGDGGGGLWGGVRSGGGGEGGVGRGRVCAVQQVERRGLALIGATVDEQGGEGGDGRLVAGRQLERPAQRSLVPRRDQLRQLGLLLARRELVDPGLHLVLRQGAHEAVDHLAVAHGVDGRDRLDLKDRKSTRLNSSH